MRSEMANRLVSVSLGQLRAQADSIDATLLAELERAGLIEQRGGKWCCTERGHNFGSALYFISVARVADDAEGDAARPVMH